MPPRIPSLLRGLLLACATTVLLGACGTRSISNSGYDADPDHRSGYWGGQRGNTMYKGELTEFDVLGIDPKATPAEAEIRAALAAKVPMTIVKGSSLVLVQSGALIPDEDMVKGMEKYFNVSVFSGVPADKDKQGSNYAPALRMAAARGGHAKLVVYWGLLETGQENLATQVVSWVPFIGGAIPDKGQRMRIRLKVALIDVQSGQWETFTPPPFEDRQLSGRYNRVASDQAQVALLKTNAYAAAVEDLVKRYAR